MTDGSDLALKAYQKAQEKVRPLILAEAEKRVQANIGRVDALNQRLSSLCALLFAGAAVAATFTTNADKIAPLAVYIAAGSSVTFVAAGVISSIGLFSARRIFPGERPSWWAGNGIEALTGLDEDGAKGWLVERHEQMIESLEAGVKHRARAFNSAVVVGLLAGAMIASAAVVGAVIGPVPKAPSTSSSTVNIFSPN